MANYNSNIAERDIPENYSDSRTGYSGNIEYLPTEKVSSWKRFNSFISNIGEVIELSSICMVPLLSYSVIFIGGGLFIAWLVSLDAILGAIAGLFLSGIVIYLLCCASNLVLIVGTVVSGVLRAIFYNGVTLIVSIIIALSLITMNAYNHYEPKIDKVAQVEQIIVPEDYICTANSSLNVREYPNLIAPKLGSIKRGTIVKVYNVSNGFATIDYNGHRAYISSDYIRKHFSTSNKTKI